jgi:hypothetical protein
LRGARDVGEKFEGDASDSLHKEESERTSSVFGADREEISLEYQTRSGMSDVLDPRKPSEGSEKETESVATGPRAQWRKTFRRVRDARNRKDGKYLLSSLHSIC